MKYVSGWLLTENGLERGSIGFENGIMHCPLLIEIGIIGNNTCPKPEIVGFSKDHPVNCA